MTTTTRNLTATRKLSKFVICERHAGWFAGTTRERKAECFVEGGPGGMAGCCPGPDGYGQPKCRLWPGRDFFVEEICHGEFALDWVQSNREDER